MLRGFLNSIVDGFRHRFGKPNDIDEYRATADEERGALGRHNDAEARVVGRTMGDPNSVRSFGKGRPR